MLSLPLYITLFFSSIQTLNNNRYADFTQNDKVIHVMVDEYGTISIGRDTVTSDELAKYIQVRLFKSYLGTGRMYDKLLFSKENNKVPDVVAAVVLKEIKEGQQKALTQLCLQKYEKRYEDISNRQQAKLKKIFPVLFQKKFS